MAGPRKPRKRPAGTAARKRPRPVLGNDPFERGAAPRATAPPAPAPAPPAEQVASGVHRLEERVELALEGAEQRLEEVLRRAGVGYGNELRELLARLGPALLARLQVLSNLYGLVEGPGPLDPWGMDERLLAGAEPLLDFLVESWWRVGLREADRLPAGGAVVVANHGGALPWDALVLRTALRRDPVRREIRPLLDARALRQPLVARVAPRLGAVAATPENALALLAQGRLVAVFPEGSLAGEKPWSDRYRLQHFGRGGFAKVALRAGVPIVPCAIVGSEEATPPASRRGWLAERLRLPLLAMAPRLPLGPLAFLPLPSRWTIRFGDPVETAGHGSPTDPAAVAALAEEARGALQRMLDEDVAARRSVFI